MQLVLQYLVRGRGRSDAAGGRASPAWQETALSGLHLKKSGCYWNDTFLPKRLSGT